MTVRQVLQENITKLRLLSDEVSSFDENLTSLLDDLADTVREQRGLGLSAPQIGAFQRVFVVNIGQRIQEFVNPVIIETSGQVDGFESCLSFPGRVLKITRPERVTVIAKNRLGRPFQITASGLLARVICHEFDHLNGVLFIDRSNHSVKGYRSTASFTKVVEGRPLML